MIYWNSLQRKKPINKRLLGVPLGLQRRLHACNPLKEQDLSEKQLFSYDQILAMLKQQLPASYIMKSLNDFQKSTLI